MEDNGTNRTMPLHHRASENGGYSVLDDDLLSVVSGRSGGMQGLLVPSSSQGSQRGVSGRSMKMSAAAVESLIMMRSATHDAK